MATDAARAIRDAHAEGLCLAPVVSDRFRSTDDGGVAYAYLAVAEGQWLLSHVRIRAGRFPLVTPGELASELAMIEIADKLEEHRRGLAVTVTRAAIEALPTFKDGWSGGVYSPGPGTPLS